MTHRTKKTLKGGNYDALQLEAVHVAPVILGFEDHNASAYSTLPQCVRIRSTRIYLDQLQNFVDLWAFTSVMAISFTAHAQKLLFSSFHLNSDNAIRFTDRDFLKERIIYRSDDILGVFFTIQIENLPYFYFRFILPGLNT